PSPTVRRRWKPFSPARAARRLRRSPRSMPSSGGPTTRRPPRRTGSPGGRGSEETVRRGERERRSGSPKRPRPEVLSPRARRAKGKATPRGRRSIDRRSGVEVLVPEKLHLPGMSAVRAAVNGAERALLSLVEPTGGHVDVLRLHFQAPTAVRDGPRLGLSPQG